MSWIWPKVNFKSIYTSLNSKFFQTIVFIFIVIFHNVSANISSGLLQMFPVKLRNLNGTSNHVFYLIACSDSVNHNWE